MVHVSDFISETIGRIKLSEAQITEQLTHSTELRLPTFEAQKITYPGKGFDPWWDLPQLINQLKHTIKVFDHTHPDCVTVFVFDRSSAHGGFAENALNIHNMNVNHGGKQRKLRNTVIPLSNPGPAPGEEDMRGRVQNMCFPDDHPNLELRGQAKGIRNVLQERKSVWDKYMICTERGMKPVGKCKSCSTSQTKKDAERHVIFAEETGEDGVASAKDVIIAHSEMPSTPDNSEMWCCMERILSSQEDF